jgi:hypothetical protein
MSGNGVDQAFARPEYREMWGTLILVPTCIFAIIQVETRAK